MMLRTALLLFIILVPCAALADIARVYYDPSKGSDANPGTQEQPVKTFEKAGSLLVGSGQIVSPAGVTTYTGARRFKLPSSTR